MRVTKRIVMLLSTMLLITVASNTALRAVPQPVLPNPVLYLTGTEVYSANGKTWVRYQYDVLNKDQYPDAMFAAAPMDFARWVKQRTWEASGLRLRMA